MISIFDLHEVKAIGVDEKEWESLHLKRLIKLFGPLSFWSHRSGVSGYKLTLVKVFENYSRVGTLSCGSKITTLYVIVPKTRIDNIQHTWDLDPDVRFSRIMNPDTGEVCANGLVVSKDGTGLLVCLEPLSEENIKNMTPEWVRA